MLVLQRNPDSQADGHRSRLPADQDPVSGLPKGDEMKQLVTPEEAALVRKVLATTGRTAPMHERHEARRIVDRLLPPMRDTGRGRGMPLAFGDAANC